MSADDRNAAKRTDDASLPCTRCGATPETGTTDGCPECEGIVEPIYGPPVSSAAWVRFFRDRSGFQ
jgi:hypothetical protein